VVQPAVPLVAQQVLQRVAPRARQQVVQLRVPLLPAQPLPRQLLPQRVLQP
jgi:hypothetical protein